LVFGGCGAAVFAADPAEDNSVGIGFLGVSLAFGLTVLAEVYAFITHVAVAATHTRVGAPVISTGYGVTFR